VDRFKALRQPGSQNENTILAQIRCGLSPLQRKGLGGSERWWKIRYSGEEGSDAGGLFRDSLSAMSMELQRAAEAFGERDLHPCPLFLPVELFGEDLAGRKQMVGAYLVPNVSSDSASALALYEFLGQLMGACSRSQEKLPVALAPLVWKQLLGREVRWEHVAELEPAVAQQLADIEAGRAPNGYQLTPEEFDNWWSSADFTISFGEPCRQVELAPGGAARKLTFSARLEYVGLVKEAYLRRYDPQIQAMRRGLLHYLPAPLLLLWTSYELELAVAGEPEVKLEKLQAEATVSLSSDRKMWFWQSVEAMTAQQRSKLLRFVTGRSRLPVGKFYVKPETRGSDGALPHSATCSFELFVPPYSSQQVLFKQLLVAIETEDFGNQ